MFGFPGEDLCPKQFKGIAHLLIITLFFLSGASQQAWFRQLSLERRLQSHCLDVFNHSRPGTDPGPGTDRLPFDDARSCADEAASLEGDIPRKVTPGRR